MYATPTVFFYVQHLHGVGHVFRATRIARALARSGCKIHLIWGGEKVPHVDLTGLTVHFLEAAHVKDANYSHLIKNNGEVFSQQDQDRRKNELLSLFHSIQPDIVITEAFPFGRRKMRFELLPLMSAAKAATNKPLCVASIRDIMQENREAKKVQESIATIETFYDLVMVHGDPKLVPIEETLQGADHFKDKIRYTGLVSPDPVSIPLEKKRNVIVSTGGGAAGQQLVEAALGAMPLCKTHPNKWTLITGVKTPKADFERLKAKAPEGMDVFLFLPQLTQEMSQTKVSVSLAGYNTVGDILRSNCHSILVPFTGGAETEQLKRALILERRNRAKVLLSENLNPQSLAHAIDSMELSKPIELDINYEGADHAAQILVKEYGAYSKKSSSSYSTARS